MNESIGERIRTVRKKEKLSQDVFGAKIDLSDGMVSMIESGKKPPQEGTILLICHVFGVSETWIRTGEGDMCNSISDTLAKQEKQLLEYFRVLPDSLKRILLGTAENMRDEQKKQDNDENNNLPFSIVDTFPPYESLVTNKPTVSDAQKKRGMTC